MHDTVSQDGGSKYYENGLTSILMKKPMEKTIDKIKQNLFKSRNNSKSQKRKLSLTAPINTESDKDFNKNKDDKKIYKKNINVNVFESKNFKTQAFTFGTPKNSSPIDIKEMKSEGSETPPELKKNKVKKIKQPPNSEFATRRIPKSANEDRDIQMKSQDTRRGEQKGTDWLNYQKIISSILEKNSKFSKNSHFKEGDSINNNSSATMGISSTNDLKIYNSNFYINFDKNDNSSKDYFLEKKYLGKQRGSMKNSFRPKLASKTRKQRKSYDFSIVDGKNNQNEELDNNTKNGIDIIVQGKKKSGKKTNKTQITSFNSSNKVLSFTTR